MTQKPKLRAVPSAPGAKKAGHICERPRVARAVERAASYPVVLVQASAGSGKSVAVAQHLHDKPHVRVAIDPLRSSLNELVFDLAMALGEPWRSSVATAISQSAKSDDPPATLVRWLRANGPPQGIVVLDDLHHFAADDPAWRFIALASQTPGMQWFLLSRAELHVPVSTMLLRGDAVAPIANETLAFTVAEIRTAAEAQGLDLSQETLEAIVKLTGGWAAGVTFALIAAAQNQDIARISFSTRELTYGYFGEQYFARLDSNARRALFVLALARRGGTELLREAGVAKPAALLHRLTREISFVEHEQNDRYRLHDLFRDFVLAMFEREEDDDLGREIGGSLERLGDSEGALEMYVRESSASDIVRVLRDCGPALVERGRSALVERALAAVGRGASRENAVLIGMRAALEELRGDFGKAIALYEQSLEAALREKTLGDVPDDFSWHCAYRLALLRVNRWQSGEPSLILEFAQTGGVERRVEALGLAALGSIVLGKLDDAGAQIAQALELLDGIDSDRVRAKALMRAAYSAFYHPGDPRRVELYANDAAAIAERCGDLETATHCYSILYAYAYAHLGDRSLALYYATQMQRAAERCGADHLRTSALRAQFEIEAYRGREERVEELDAQLRTLRGGYRDTLAYLHAKALWSAWGGDFAQAARLIFPLTAQNLPAEEARCVRALLSFYYAADDRAREADAELLRAGNKPAGDPLNPVSADYVALAAVFASLAQTLLGRGKAARRFLPAHRHAFRGGDEAVYDAILTLTASASPNAPALNRAAEELREAGFGGLARVLGQLADRSGKEQPRPLLTTSELAILRAMAQGSTAKEIASRTNRSYETVRSHIKTICRKLECGGTLEAVAAARRLNLL